MSKEHNYKIHIGTFEGERNPARLEAVVEDGEELITPEKAFGDSIKIFLFLIRHVPEIVALQSCRLVVKAFQSEKENPGTGQEHIRMAVETLKRVEQGEKLIDIFRDLQFQTMPVAGSA